MGSHIIIRLRADQSIERIRHPPRTNHYHPHAAHATPVRVGCLKIYCRKIIHCQQSLVNPFSDGKDTARAGPMSHGQAPETLRTGPAAFYFVSVRLCKGPAEVCFVAKLTGEGPTDCHFVTDLPRAGLTGYV